ncbi:MAG: DNA polymerase III subunit beta [Sulfurihydrogenibium sp.]|nr:DNA polymerase III subunit beta [Sulfurihydrogenibium sp.]
MVNFKISKKELSEALKIIQTSKIFPILEKVRLTVSQDGLIIDGFDNEIYTSVKLKHNGNVNGTIQALIPKKMFSDIVKKLKEKEITISIDNENVYIGGITIKADNDILMEYPNMEIPENKITCDGISLFNAINKVKHASTKDPDKFSINGICINKNEIVATDGHRLALYTLDTAITENRLLIPYKTVNLLMKIKPKNSINIYYNQDKICFEINNIKILSYQLENRYPNYHDVIPKDATNNIVFKIDKQALLDAIEKVIVADDRKEKPIVLDIIDNKLIIKTSQTKYDEASYYSEASIDISIFKNNLGNYRIGFNGLYLIDAINSVEDEAIIKLIDKDSQITVLDANYDNYIALVMPMEIKE